MCVLACCIFPEPVTTSISASEAAEANLEVFNITSSGTCTSGKDRSRLPSTKSTTSGSQWSPEDKVFYGDSSTLGGALSVASQEQKSAEHANGDIRSEQSISPYSIRTLSNTPTPTRNHNRTPQQLNPESLAIFEQAKRLHEQWKLAEGAPGPRRYSDARPSNGYQPQNRLSKSIENIELSNPSTDGGGHRRPEFSSHAKIRYDQQVTQTPTYASVSKPSSYSSQSVSVAGRPRINTDPALYASAYTRHVRGRPQMARSLTGLNAQDNWEYGRHQQAGSTYSLSYEREPSQSPVHVAYRQYEATSRSSGRRRQSSTSSSRRSITPQGQDDHLYAEAPYSTGRPPPLPARNNSSLSNQELQYHHIELHRPGRNSSIPAGFGFSISDGKDERGVYVRALQPNGVAELSGKIFPLDRIMEV